MDQQTGGDGVRRFGPLVQSRIRSLAADCSQLLSKHWSTLMAQDRAHVIAVGRGVLRDSMAGVVGSIMLIANIVSFAALMFPGELSAGIPVAIWAMLVGSCISGVIIAATTSLPPLATGIDSPTGAVLVALSAATAAGLMASGSSPQAVVPAVMLTFTAATIVSGVVLYGIGVCRCASYLRFVPYFVVGGFLVATGWFLIAGGIRMSIGRPFAFGVLAGGLTWIEAAKFTASVGTLAVLLALRYSVKSALAMPGALLAMTIAGAMVLRGLGLSAPEQGWYLHSLGTLSAWFPFAAMRTSHFTWSMAPSLISELLAVSVVALISLVTKVSSTEVSRQTSGDLDREFRANGIGSLIAAPLGGLTAALQIGTSRLLEHLGSGARTSGIACSLMLGFVALLNFDLPGFIPIPVVAGLVYYLGYTFLVDALWRPYVQRAWVDILLAVGIAVACVQYGYLVGVLGGIIGACLLFAASYARIGAVRRHVTRAQFASNVDRSAEAGAHLRESGDAIQLYWLAGYIFFGSSEGVFERVRDDVEALPPGKVKYVILDFAAVPSADTSAIFSLTKLRNFCHQHGVTLAYSSLSPASRRALELGGLFAGKGRYEIFTDLNQALAWCENQLLAQAGLDVYTGLAGFKTWLERQLGPAVHVDDFLAYLERKDVTNSQVLHREGDPADCIDFVAAGGITIDLARGDGGSVCVRRIMTHSVVGEMGFFRHTTRSATVSAEAPVTLFSLTRANFERLRRERPDLALAFHDFIVRVLADRIDFANREVLALSR
jgi:sulfate permease, SulP family